MPVRIRLARHGTRHHPHYYINVANSWAKRDGKFIEKLGEYNPLPDANGIKRITLDFQRVKYWISVGAQPTDTVARLLGKAGILPSLPRGPIRKVEGLLSTENNSMATEEKVVADGEGEGEETSKSINQC